MRKLLDAEFESDVFAGKLDALMIECFIDGVRGLGHTVFDSSHDPQHMKVDIQGVGHRTSLDVAVAGAEQNDACLRLRLEMNPPQEGDDPNAVPLPELEMNGPISLRRE